MQTAAAASSRIAAVGDRRVVRVMFGSCTKNELINQVCDILEFNYLGWKERESSRMTSVLPSVCVAGANLVHAPLPDILLTV